MGFFFFIWYFFFYIMICIFEWFKLVIGGFQLMVNMFMMSCFVVVLMNYSHHNS